VRSQGGHTGIISWAIQGNGWHILHSGQVCQTTFVPDKDVAPGNMSGHFSYRGQSNQVYQPLGRAGLFKCRHLRSLMTGPEYGKPGCAKGGRLC
jgi:hypothetical protein